MLLLTLAGEHRQPVLAPPHAAAEQVKLHGIKVTRGIVEDGYIEYEIETQHEVSPASPGFVFGYPPEH